MSVVQNIRLNSISTSPYNAGYSYMTSAIPTNTENFVFIDPEEIANIEVEETGKYSIFDVADCFLSQSDMTHKKLQKLCYYAQAWAYALKGYRLEDTDYQAWVHSPVSPALWERFKTFGYRVLLCGSGNGV